MKDLKYRHGMNFEEFMYFNYGASYTKDQENKAFAFYISFVKGGVSVGLTISK